MRSQHTLFASFALTIAQSCVGLIATAHAADAPAKQAAPSAATPVASSSSAARAAAISSAMATLQERQKKAREEEAKQKDDVVEINDRDPAMRAAFKQAQATLDDFLKVAASKNPNLNYMAMRVAVTEGKRKEYLWISPFEVDGNGFKGTLDNVARKLKRVQIGQSVRFRRTDVVDWMYTDAVKRTMHGNYTTCAQLAKAPPEEALQLKRTFGLDCQKR